jgi:multidrug efflux pump subunit AcrB
MKDGNQNIAAKIARFFTFNKPLSILVVLAITLAGVGLFSVTPKQYNPDIERPAFEVVVEYPGARASEVEKFVTKELVEKVTELEGVDEVTARSIDGGRSVATVLFEVGESLENSKVRLFTQMEENIDFKKGKIQAPRIRSINPDDVPILTFVLLSDTKTQNEIRHDAVGVMNSLKEVAGVANLEVHGGEPGALSVILDTERMRERGVAITDVRDALQSSNVKHKHGHITDNGRVISLETDGSIKTPEDARDIIVRPGVYLSDIATVVDGYSQQDSFVKYYNKKVNEDLVSAVYLSVGKQENTNAPSLSSSVRSKLSNLMQSDEYEQISYQVVRDDGQVAQKEVNSLGSNLLISVLIVGIVLFGFLSLRPAIVVMTAIPLTLLLVLTTGYFFGQTINRITLFALILSLGLLVDSATVVAENIYRHIQKGDRSRKEAIVHAVDQVGIGLIISTITSVVVFVPMRFITGMMGPYMGPVAFFVPAALIMALVVAFVVTPPLSNVVLSSSDGKRGESGDSGNIFKPIIRTYERTQRRILHSRTQQNWILGTVGVLLLIVLSFPIFQLVQFQMLPKADKQEYYIYLDASEGASAPRTLEETGKVINVLEKGPETKSVQAFVGTAPVIDFSGLFRGAQQRIGDHQATLKVNLSDPQERSETSPEIVSATRQRVKQAATLRKGTKLKFAEIPPGPPVRSTFLADIKGGDRLGRERVASRISEALKETPGAADVDTSIPDTYSRITVDIDTAKALSYGVSPRTIAQTLEMVTTPTQVSQYHAYDQNEFAPVEVRLPRNRRDAPNDYRNIDVRSNDGSLVPLSSVTQQKYSRNVPVIYSDGLAQATQVSASVDQRSVVYVVIDVIEKILDFANAPETGEVIDWGLYGMEYKAPDGAIYKIEWGGEWELTLNNFRDLGLAMLVAFFAVFIVLVAKYRSFKTPALLMATVPFGLIGILPGFALLDVLSGIPLTATGLIGFIALIGIVVNNAIIFLEYFNQIKNKEGIDDREALIEAGKVRMRPIILTSLTTVLATLTIAFDPVWSGLAWSIVFGLSLSAFMTLGIFPILYARFIAIE